MKTKPETEVTAKITVSIDGQAFELTVAEAKKLKAQLEAAIPEKPHPIFVPHPYPVPVPEPIPYRPRRPWQDPVWVHDRTDFQRMFQQTNDDFPPMTICLAAQ